MFGLQMGRLGGRTGRSLAGQVKALFSAAEQGAWFDPSDWTTLSQDSAGTLPVTAVGQPIGRMLDKSGRGNHASQITAINRPVLQQDASGRYFLAFNGTNSWMSTAAINFTSTDKMTLVAGLQCANTTSIAIIAELGSTPSVSGWFYLVSNAAPGNYRAYAQGSAAIAFIDSVAAVLVKTVVTETVALSSAAGSPNIRTNGENLRASPTLLGAATFLNAPVFIGARGGSANFFNGNFYGLILHGASTSTPQIAIAERFMNSKTGAF